jgi:hypothetical protein
VKERECPSLKLITSLDGVIIVVAFNAKWHSKFMYWCAFGPNDEGSIKPKELPRKGTFSPGGKRVGSHSWVVKHDYNCHKKRGCQAHFLVIRFKIDLDIAVIKLVNK